MQDIYAFDVGDFGKIGLLRHLAVRASLQLGVLWWRTTLGAVGADGRHVGYLEQQRFRLCDDELWREMRARFDRDRRRIVDLHPLFPSGTLFHDEPVPRERRPEWLGAARAHVREADIVFCDPDNGVGFNGTQRGSLRHIGEDEVCELFAGGHSLVLYHHLNRDGTHAEQVRRGLARLRELLPEMHGAWGARYRRGTSRVFFVLAQPRHHQALADAVGELGGSPWVRGRHFEVSELARGE